MLESADAAHDVNGTQSSSKATSNDRSTTTAGAASRGFRRVGRAASRSPPCYARRTPPPGEDAELRLERAREAAGRGPLGHHTHFVGPAHARPAAGGAEHAERVRSEALWLRENGLEPQLFCGGGWYIDECVASLLAELGYADCTGTAFVPSYLDEGAPALR